MYACLLAMSLLGLLRLRPSCANLRSWKLFRLFKLIGKGQRRAIRYNEHLTGDGPTTFDHVCRMGLEGIVSKRTVAPYRSGPSMVWLKSKNPASEAVRPEREGERA